MLLSVVGWPMAAAAQDVSPPKAYTLTPGGINASDGGLVYSVTDLSLGSVSLERYHRSGLRQPNRGMFGKNFSSNFDIFIARDLQGPNNTAIVHIGNSASGLYSQIGTTPQVLLSLNLDAEKGRLTWTGTQYVYLDSAGTIYTFSSTVRALGAIWQDYSRRIESIEFPDGRRQSFSYTNEKLKLVEDSSGYALVFDYEGSDVVAACVFKRSDTFVSLTTTCAGAPIRTAYGYSLDVSTSRVLSSATDVLGRVTAYTNEARGVTCITPPGFAGCARSQTPGPDQQDISFTTTQTLSDGGTWVVSGFDSEAVAKGDDRALARENGHLEVTVADPTTPNQIRLTFSKSSPFSMTDALGRITWFKFEGGVPLNDPGWGNISFGSMLREAVYPEGDKYQAEYLGPFRALSVERHVPKDGSAPLERLYLHATSCTVAPATYQNCAKPIAIRDPAGNWTHYTYDARGNPLTETGPAPVANGARPLKVTTWQERRAWLRTSPGTFAEGPPISLKTSETQCQTVAGADPAPVCDANAPQTVTTYEYGAAQTAQSLLVKGVVVTADGIGLLTCYGYDPFDRRISETSPNANLASCP